MVSENDAVQGAFAATIMNIRRANALRALQEHMHAIRAFTGTNIGSTFIPLRQARNLRDLFSRGEPVIPFANIVSMTSLLISDPRIGVEVEATVCPILARLSRTESTLSRSLATDEINLITTTTSR